MTEDRTADCRRRGDCRACGSTRLSSFLDLGAQPPANALLRSSDEFATERRFPLEVFLCEACGLVQLLDVVDPELLFGHYLYLTGTSSTMRRHFDDYAAAALEGLQDPAAALVVEVASNDGSLLSSFATRGAAVLGIEPARNVARIARDRGIETISEFFDLAVARRIRAARGTAALAVANNVLAHVDDARGFLEGLAHLVGEEGRVIVEVPWVAELFRRLEYDTIYHEHLSYFSIGALMVLFRSAGLSIAEVRHQTVHGGSLRVIAVSRRRLPEHDAAVGAAADREAAEGLNSLAAWIEFAGRVRENRRRLVELVDSRLRAGRRVAAYGAPAKGNTLLNFAGLGGERLQFTVDRNPLKSGRFLPGTHIPVLAPEAIEERKPDDLLILPWNIAEEIIEQESGHRARGGCFLVPIPEPRVL